jgi:hypothetical protein
MRRRGEGDADSLELMLDTICNMFAVIIVAALIAAVIVMSRGPGAEDLGEPEDDASEMREIGRLQERIERLEKELERYPAPKEAADEDAAVDRVAAALAETERRRQIVEKYRSAVEAVRKGMTSLAGGTTALRAEVSRLEESLEAARRAKERTVRTPMEREVELDIFVIVLWQDRLYPICDLSNRHADRCEWLRQWDDRYVVASRCRTPVFQCGGMGGINVERRVELRPDAGIPVIDSAGLRANPEAMALIGRLRTDLDIIGFSVAPDSFDSFAAVKDFFLSNGFQYNVSPTVDPLPNYTDSWISGKPRGL